MLNGAEGQMFVARLFWEHPASVGESYRQHMRVALGFAGPLAKAAAAAGVHAFLPFLFKTTASRTVRQLNDRMTRRCATCVSGPAHRPDLFPQRLDLTPIPAHAPDYMI